MTSRKGLRVKDAFRFLSVGRFYWRLLILPVIGAVLMFASMGYNVILEASIGDSILPFSFTGIFFTTYLVTLGFIGSSVRNKITRIMNLIQLLPIAKREKYFWLYLRSTWLPAILLFAGAIVAVFLTDRNALGLLLPFLPYVIAAVLLLSILHWKGSFDVVDTETLIGVVASREETLLSYVSFALLISPIIYDFLPLFLKVMTAVLVFVIALMYGRSFAHEVQINEGVFLQDDHNIKDEKQVNLSFLAPIKSSLVRYFYYLEWTEIKKTVNFFKLNFVTVLFFVIVYYAIGGLFAPGNEISNFERGVMLCLFISFFTFNMRHTSDVAKETNILLPLSQSKKAVANMISQILRPTVYTFINTIGIVLLIDFLHWGLSLVIEQPQLLHGRLVLYTLPHIFTILALAIAAFSFMDFLLNFLIVIMQRFGYFKADNWLIAISTFFNTVAFFAVAMMLIGRSLSVEIFLGYPAIALYGMIFLLSRIGLYFVTKRIQVVTR